MHFQKVLQGLPLIASEGDLGCDVTRVVYDSRNVQPGDLFVALRGDHTDGHLFIEQAFKAGAVAALVEEPVSAPCWAQVSDTLPALAQISDRLYGRPAAGFKKTVGVTGSNGKSTFTYLIERIGETAGESVGLVGTIEYRWPGVSMLAPHTTPFSSDLQHALSEMRNAGVSQLVMEVSSHALALHRVDTLKFDVAVFTNLSHEHLDFHGNMEEYAAAKFKLFTDHLKPGGTAVINTDDRWGRSWVPQLGADRCLTYGFSGAANVYPENFDLSAAGVEGVIWTPEGHLILESTLLGRHNLYNLLASISASLALGTELTTIEEALRQPIVIPGRLEGVDRGQPFRVLVDYAHTPDGLRQVLATLVELPHRRLICVVGAGGDRDRKKRPLMASIAQEIADTVVFTSDNPRTEDPEKILDEMEVGVVGAPGSNYHRIPDRREAIAKAIDCAEPEDIVLIAGKGHEDYQEIHGVRHPFDDRIEAAAALEGKGYGGGKA